MTTIQAAIDPMPVSRSRMLRPQRGGPVFSRHSLEEVGRWKTQFPPIRG
jgi:hypothetical protein